MDAYTNAIIYPFSGLDYLIGHNKAIINLYKAIIHIKS